MKNVMETNLEQLAEGQYKRISLGLKPSGLIHLGTAMTFLHGILVLKNNPEAILDVAVMDLDFDFQKGRNFLSYQKTPDIAGCHILMKEHTMQETINVLSGMANHFGIGALRFNVSYFGEVTENAIFQKHLAHLFTTDEGNRILKQTISKGTGTRPQSLLSPICESCYHSSTGKPRIDKANTTLTTICYNEKCDVEKYSVGLTEPRRINIFYLVDPIRDLIPNENGANADLHIFGGDYSNPYGADDTSKAERVFGLLSAISENHPSIYVGPSIVFNGVKIGKSKRNGFDMGTLTKKFSNWPDRIHDLLKDNSTEKVLELNALEHYFS